jgi:small-conductance mechanosensitive channel
MMGETLLNVKDLTIEQAYDLILGKVMSWAEHFISMLPNIALAILVFILFFFASKGISSLIRVLLLKSTQNRAIVNLFTGIIYFVLIIIGIFASLSILNLDKTVTSLLAGAGFIGLALSFAFQNSATNLMSGVMMGFTKPFAPGDVIESNGFWATVQHISLRATVLKTFQGQEVIIPNKEVFENPITNYTKYGVRRIDLGIGVSYGDDLEKVQKVTLAAVDKLEEVRADIADPTAFFYEFGDSSINFILRVWVNYPNQPGYLKMQSDLIIGVKKAFDENDITIPFPIRTLDFGIKGGKELTTTLSESSGVFSGKS